jgi:hypothetical protein
MRKMRRVHALIVLGIFFFANMLQGSTWAALAAVPKASAELFGTSHVQLSWQMNANNISQTLCALPTMWLLQQRSGLRSVIHLGIGLICAQCTLWWLTSMSEGLVDAANIVTSALLSGAVLGGGGEMLLQSVPTQLSATWFPPRYRGIATAIASSGGYAGQTVSYLADYDITSAARLSAVLLFNAAAALALLVAALVAVRNAPEQALMLGAVERGYGSGTKWSGESDEETKSLLKQSSQSFTSAYFMYRYISRESCSQFDSLPLTSLTISGGDGALQSFTSASYGALPVHRTELSGPSDAVSVPWRRFCDPSCVILVVASASINAVFTSWLALLPILTTNAPQVSFYVPLHFTRILLTV